MFAGREAPNYTLVNLTPCLCFVYKTHTIFGFSMVSDIQFQAILV